ncbi:MAG: hypothetical protein E6I23_09305 [Chloroflexi bacterium]|nr:MAG: hypothetical protein E6I23_09305 [Chloroflexota bacterium]
MPRTKKKTPAKTTTFPQVGPEEYAARRTAVCAGMDAAGLDALAVFYPARIAYLTGFHHIPTERPIVLIPSWSRSMPSRGAQVPTTTGTRRTGVTADRY